MIINVKQRKILPNPIKLERYRRSPDLSPCILFFSGGTALRNTCKELTNYTHNSIHIITPFDSGGSSAKLREAFQMPAVGDIRNRLLALADQGFQGSPEISDLLAYRFSEIDTPDKLLSEMDSMIDGSHILMKNIPYPVFKIIQNYLELFKNFMPENFDLRKASIGNLLLTAGYLNNQKDLDAVIYIFSNLVRARGIVAPVVDNYLHLIAELENGQIIAGQHRLTGKETCMIKSKVKNIWLSRDCKDMSPVNPVIMEKTNALIDKAELICYPVGSFYSSIIANLLPEGIGKAVSNNSCPKIYIPNSDNNDPESFGLDINQQIKQLLFYLRKDDPENIYPAHVLNIVLMDEENGNYKGKIDKQLFSQMGIKVINMPLASPETRPQIDEKLLVPILMSLT